MLFASQAKRADRNLTTRKIKTRASARSGASPILECGGLPPLSSKLNIPQQTALGEACLAYSPQHVYASATVGALLVNCATAQFILRFRRAGSKGCAPTCQGVSLAPQSALSITNASGTTRREPLLPPAYGRFTNRSPPIPVLGFSAIGLKDFGKGGRGSPALPYILLAGIQSRRGDDDSGATTQGPETGLSRN